MRPTETANQADQTYQDEHTTAQVIDISTFSMLIVLSATVCACPSVHNPF